MATTEHTLNDALALALRGSRRAWRAHGVIQSEAIGLLKGGHGRADILVLEPYVSPVVIETEVLPAQTVEPEAKSRLGVTIKSNGRRVLSSIAVRLPKRLRLLDPSELQSKLSTADDLEMALFTGISPGEAERWPHTNWLPGGVADLSFLTQAATVPPEVVDRAADELIAGVEETAGLLADAVGTYPGAVQKISDELRQAPGTQTWRMVATILASAFVFHDSLAGGTGGLADVRSIEQLRGAGDLSKTSVLAQWRKILLVNYWSIFDIARRLLEYVPSHVAGPVVGTMARTADRLLAHRLMRSHDLTGAVFQRVIADRKFLAAYYTTPAAAALLAGLAIRDSVTPAGQAWSDTASLKHMRVADFACGTGTLLSAAYQRINQLHEVAGGDATELHETMMGGSLVGCDVLPAAAHLTAATLASVHPTVRYGESSILTLAYGRQPSGAVSLGSIDLLETQRPFEILAVTAKAVEGKRETQRDIWASLPHYNFDLVIMNPPFTRDTGQEGKKIGVRNPMFAAFQADAGTQALMARLTKQLTDKTSAHGNAGEASIFLVLADRKLKQGGTLAMVLPLSFMLGDAWEDSRRLVASRYSELVMISNAGTSGVPLSFSADTDMGECLVVGRKAVNGSNRATFVTLRERPESPVAGSHVAGRIQQILSRRAVRRLEEGPVGGTPIVLGGELIGQAIDGPLNYAGGWNLARIQDFSLAQVAHQLARGVVWLPGLGKSDAREIQASRVGSMGRIGPYHADINGRTQSGGIRGPFDIHAVQDGDVPTYPVLWSHDAERERTMAFEAESQGIPAPGRDRAEQELITRKVEAVWATASHSHFNRDFRFNSQSTAMQFTPRRTIGGRAWLSIDLGDAQLEKILVLWANSSLGILMYWWQSNRQQAGRGSIGKEALKDLIVLNARALSAEQKQTAVAAFDELRGQPMRPAHELDRDDCRAALDRLLMCDVLRLPTEWHDSDGPVQVLRMKLAREPSISGHKGRSAD